MRPGDPKPNPMEVRSMNERETLDFLAQNGIRQLSLEDWNPGDPLLFVFEERMRGPSGPLGKYAKSLMPNLARINHPERIYSDGSSEIMYALENNGEQIDYYAIDPITKKITHVKTSARVRTSSTEPYYVNINNLFEPNDNLFPKK